MHRVRILNITDVDWSFYVFLNVFLCLDLLQQGARGPADQDQGSAVWWQTWLGAPSGGGKTQKPNYALSPIYMQVQELSDYLPKYPCVSVSSSFLFLYSWRRCVRSCWPGPLSTRVSLSSCVSWRLPSSCQLKICAPRWSARPASHWGKISSWGGCSVLPRSLNVFGNKE